MLVIRPVMLSDLDQLLELTGSAGFGLTTLPRDPEYLRKRIVRSQRSFERMGDQPAGESYLFVLEDTQSGRVIGTSAIVSKVGGFEPFYAYKIESTVHESKFLGVRKEIRVLHLVAEHNGPCEIGSLMVAPQHRGASNGRLLSLSRFLFMAENPASFDPLVLAEMRGVVDGDGRSHFWDAVGKHFFEIDYPKADYLSVINKRFIADLMPKYPVYITLLPADAQAVIGRVHDQTRPALRLLEEEGFRFSGMVDMFDAGPLVTCPLQDVRVVRESRVAPIAEIVSEEVASEPLILTNGRRDFRACKGTLLHASGAGVRITSGCAEALGIRVGDSIRFAPLRSSLPAAPREPIDAAAVSAAAAAGSGI